MLASTKGFYFLIAFILAVGLDVLLIRRWRRAISPGHKGPGERDAGVFSLGGYSPVLAWLKRIRLSIGTLFSKASRAPDMTNAHAHTCRVRTELRFTLVEGQSIKLVLNPRAALPFGTDPSAGSIADAPEVTKEEQKAAIHILPEWLTNALRNIKFLTGAALFLAAVPAALVTYQYWFRWPLRLDFLENAWDALGLNHHFAYPSYFLMIVAVTLLLLIVFRFNRIELGNEIFIPGHRDRIVAAVESSAFRAWVGKGAILVALLLTIVGIGVQLRNGEANGWFYLPALLLYVAGWSLWSADLEALWQRLRRSWEPILAFLFFHVSLVGLLSEFYSSQGSIVLWVILMVMSVALVSRYFHRIDPVFWIASLALVLYTIRINGWEFSVVGDEYSFYMEAQALVEKSNFVYVISRLYDGTKVFGSHPFFSSALQMLSMIVFEDNNFGWRFSNPYLCSLAIPFFYYFVRRFFHARIAFYSVLFLAASHYLMTFGKIGYNNLQALFVMSLVLAAGGWAVQEKSDYAFAIFGLSLGVCFYVYPAALYVLPVGYLLLFFYHRPVSRRVILQWGIAIGSMLLLVLPLLFQLDYWREKIPGTVLWVPDLMASTGMVLEYLYTNLVYAFYSFVYTPKETHYVVISYVDALTGILYLLGFAYVLTRWRRKRFFAYFLSVFIAMLLLVGMSHGRPFPPTTRMFLFLPWFALGAALGLSWLQAAGKEFNYSPALIAAVSALLLVAVFNLNLYQAYSVSKSRSTGLQSPEMLFMRLIERIRVQRPDHTLPVQFTFLTTPEWGIDGYRLLLDTYEVPGSLVQLDKLDVDDPALTEDARLRMAEPDRLAIINPLIDDRLQSDLSGTMDELGKIPCDVKTVTGDKRFEMWYSPPMDWLCYDETR